MSTYLGDFRTGKTVRKMWNTNAIAGESITRATNGTVSVYKDGGTTQSTTGVTDTEDFDSLTGVHLVAVDTSADGTFYSSGSEFEVVLSAATIDGKTINATLFSFSLENRSGLMPTTDGRKLDVSAGGEAGVDWANVGSPTTAVNLSATNIDVDQVVASVSGAVGSVTGAVTVGTNNDKTGYRLSSTGVDDILDEVVEGSNTVRQYLRGMASALLAKLSGASTTTIVIRDVGDTKDRITATVDADGNRSAITTDFT